MRLVLEIVSGPDAGARTHLRPGDTYRIGRGKDADLQIRNDALVSRNHFLIECADTECRIRDLNSSNGTFVNGAAITETVLRDGDEILAGGTTVVAHIEQEEGVATAATRHGPVVPTSDTSRPMVRSSRRPYSAGLADPDPAVRRAALLAAAWGREQWVLEHCAKLAGNPALEYWDEIILLGILGHASHLQPILALVKFVELGPRRFQPLGAFGHPSVVPALLDAIAGEDPLAAVAAGAAFSKITGADIDSGRVVAVVPPHQGESNEAGEAAPDQVLLPSIELARSHWNDVKSRFAKGVRWSRGFDLSRGATEEILAQLDLESRWEACLRGRFEGTWKGSMIDLEVFPQARR